MLLLLGVLRHYPQVETVHACMTTEGCPTVLSFYCVCTLFSPKGCPSLLSLCHSFIHYRVITATPLTTPQHTWPLILPTCQSTYTTLHHFPQHDSNTVHCFVSCPSSLITPHHNTSAAHHLTGHHAYGLYVHHVAPHCINLLHMRAPMCGYIPETDGCSQYSLLDSAYAGFLCIATAPAPTPSLWRPMEWEVSMN